MKLAIIINPNLSKGGWNYLHNLVSGFIKINENIEITLLAYDKNILANEIALKLKEKENNVKILIRDIYKYKKVSDIKVVDKIYNYLRTKKKLSITDLEEEISVDYDVLFYSWPYEIDVLDVKIPMFFIPHDFILSHFYGSYYGNDIYTRENWFKNKNNFIKFFEKGTPIVSTPFVKDEIARIFPTHEQKTKVVYLSSFSIDGNIASEKDILKKYGLDFEYIICPNNAQLHKNLGQLISAFYYVKQRHPDIKLILTGYQTDGIKCAIKTPYYADFSNEENSNYDMKSLGEIPAGDFSVILKNAKVVVNPSLCEAGTGSGLEAWSAGVPVAMSDIPSFIQQMEFLGTRAELFNPRNSESIADAILKLIENPKLSEEYAEISKDAIGRYTWKDVAMRYMKIFKEI